MYGLDGWAIHHNVSLWREGYPSDGFVYWFFWNMSGAWLCDHIWEHYLFTHDEAFLREHYPLMAGAGSLLLGMARRGRRGAPDYSCRTSPENHFYLPNGREASVCPGPTMDIAVIRNPFHPDDRGGRYARRQRRTDRNPAGARSCGCVPTGPARTDNCWSGTGSTARPNRSTAMCRTFSALSRFGDHASDACRVRRCPADASRPRRSDDGVEHGVENLPVGASARRRPRLGDAG